MQVKEKNIKFFLYKLTVIYLFGSVITEKDSESKNVYSNYFPNEDAIRQVIKDSNENHPVTFNNANTLEKNEFNQNNYENIMETKNIKLKENNFLLVSGNIIDNNETFNNNKSKGNEYILINKIHHLL